MVVLEALAVVGGWWLVVLMLALVLALVLRALELVWCRWCWGRWRWCRERYRWRCSR